MYHVHRTALGGMRTRYNDTIKKNLFMCMISESERIACDQFGVGEGGKESNRCARTLREIWRNPHSHSIDSRSVLCGKLLISKRLIVCIVFLSDFFV